MQCFQDYAIEINPDEEVMRIYDRVPDQIVQNSERFRLRRSGYCVATEIELPELSAETVLLYGRVRAEPAVPSPVEVL